MRATAGASIGVAALLAAGCTSAVVDDTANERFTAASGHAFEDGLLACDPAATRILVLPTDGDSLLEGDWFDRRGVEKRHRTKRREHTREIEERLRARGWKIVTYDDDVLGRLRRQHARLAGDEFVSLATHVGSSLGAEIVVEPRLDFFYDTVHSAVDASWVTTLNWVADYRFVDARDDSEVASRWVDTRDVASLERWAPRPLEGTAPEAGVLEASAPLARESSGAEEVQSAPPARMEDSPRSEERTPAVDEVPDSGGAPLEH